MESDRTFTKENQPNQRIVLNPKPDIAKEIYLPKKILTNQQPVDARQGDGLQDYNDIHSKRICGAGGVMLGKLNQDCAAVAKRGVKKEETNHDSTRCTGQKIVKGIVLISVQGVRIIRRRSLLMNFDPCA